MQCKVTHHKCYSVSYNLENFKKLTQKTHFFALFQRFFPHALLQPVGDAPIFCQIKGLMEIYNRAKFHEYSICGFQVMNVQMFSEQQKIPFLGALGWFFGHNSPKYSQILFRFGTYITVFDTVLKIRRNQPKNLILWLVFRSFWTTPSFAVWVTLQYLGK